jgi:hypothetical protein
MSNDVPPTRSRSGLSALARVASRATDAVERPLLLAVSTVKRSFFKFSTLELDPRRAPPCFVSGCVASYAALRLEISFARCAGVRDC